MNRVALVGMGYPVQRSLRDARSLLPGGGTSEILCLMIGRDLDRDRAIVFGHLRRDSGESA